MLTLGDIYYILFRHKWKILVISGLGVIAGLLVPVLWPHIYESEAKLLVKYVVDNRVLSDPSGSARVTLPDGAGRNIINTELQILTSLDLDEEVATNVGADKIMGKPNSNVLQAAGFIHSHLLVDPNNSDVIRIVFQHSDPAVVQPVLSEVIATYLKRHAEVHRPEGADEFLTQETDRLKNRLAQTEELLRSAKTNLGIISLADAEQAFGEKISKIQQDIDDTQATLAEHQATADALSKRIKVDQLPTNGVVTAKVDTNSVTPEKLAEYKHVSEMLEAFKEKDKALLLWALPENSQVKAVEGQIASLDKQKKQLETNSPGLLAEKTADAPEQKAVDSGVAPLQNSLISELALVAGLQSKVSVLTNELAEIQERFAAVDAGASTITELERTQKMEEEHYTYYSESLENAHIDEALGPGKGSNINTIQNPSPPFRDVSKMMKAAVGIPIAAIAFALALAFVTELYFDHTMKRPADIEARLGVPLFLSIPYRNGKGKVRLLNAPPPATLVLRSELIGRSIPLNGTKTTIGRLPDNTVPIDDGSISLYHCEIFSRNGEVTVKDLGSTNGTFVDGQRIVEAPLRTGQMLRVGSVEFQVDEHEPAKDPVPEKATAVTPPWDPRHALRPFYDTLRDRLITYFEVKNLTHNPKLVALTSCGDRAGVTSTAAGLAAALSETGEGNVLLVDMNVERGAAHHFYKGHLSCGIDEALTKEKRHEALVQDNLYVVTESSAREDSLPRVLPKRFTSLVPKLKASDYDYIIFDMPPMSQISITPRLARFMDMVMVVVESEKTDRDVVQRAVSMLTESHANVGVVLNKRKNYVPQRIQQEL
jgi:pSer/pThr/pTyr-binding forkhead associated (FHA) protein/uncharacterized protein involved in exopolysaccharide biosynthesis